MLSTTSLLFVSHLTLSCKLLTEDCQVLTCFFEEQTVAGFLKDKCCTMNVVESTVGSEFA